MCVCNGDHKNEQMIAEFSFLNPQPVRPFLKTFQGDDFAKSSLPVSGARRAQSRPSQ